MLEAALMWYRNFHADFEGIGFWFHDYDPCIDFKMVIGLQYLIRFHADDILSSHKNAKVNDNFAIWAQKEYGSVKSVEVKRGKIHKFLGMTLDFSKAGECHVLQNEHIEDIVRFWPEELKETTKELTPSTSSLFEKDQGGLLSD